MQRHAHSIALAAGWLLRCCCAAWLILGLAGDARAQGSEAWVRGRVLLPDGTGAKGAIVSLRTRVEEPDGSRKTRMSESMKSGKSGAFTLSYPATTDFECTLTATLAGYAPLTWNWSERPQEGPLVLAARRFDEPCYITGSIVDADGSLEIDRWRVYAESGGERFFYSSRRGGAFRPDSLTGEFRIGPLPPGAAEIFGFHDRGLRTETVKVQVRAEEEPHVILRYAGPRLATSIGIQVDAAEVSGLGLGNKSFLSGLEREGSHLFLLGSDGAVLAEATSPELFSRVWWFPDVAPGEYTLELRHPYFEPVRVEDAMPGKEYQVKLRGSAQIELHVQGSDGVDLDEYELKIRYQSGSLPIAAYPLVELGEPLPLDRLYSGIVPGDVALEIRTGGGERALVPVGRVEPGERKTVQAQLAAAVPMRVRVVDADGVGVADLEVEAVMGTEQGLGMRPQSFRSGGLRTIHAAVAEGLPLPLRTDADGYVTITDAVPGQWTLRAVRSDYADTVLTFEHPASEEAPIVLQLPALARLEGQLLCSQDFDFSTVRVAIMLRGGDGGLTTSVWPQSRPKIAEDGSFLIEGLPVGEVQLFFSLESLDYRIDGKLASLTNQTIDVKAGVQSWELDIDAFLRASCEVSLTVDGKPQAGLRVALISEKRLERYARRPRPRGLLGSEGVTNSDGYAVVRDLPPAAAFGAFVVGGDWITFVGEVADQSYFDFGRIEAALELVERRIQVRSASGAPLAKLQVGWSCRSMTVEEAKAVTNEDGEITLRMPVGSYALHRADRRRPDLVPFEWTAGEEPVRVVLEEDD